MIPFSAEYDICERVLIRSDRQFSALHPRDPALADHVRVAETVLEPVGDERVQRRTIEVPEPRLDSMRVSGDDRAIVFKPRPKRS